VDDNTLFARRQFLKQAMAAGLLSAGTLAAWTESAYAMGKIPKRLTPPKSIYELKGKVLVNGQKATEKTIISATSTVETGSGSFVVFVVGADAHILRENSKVSFSGTDFLEEGLRLVTGKLMSVFGHRSSPREQLKMRTTTATIGIRGTGVYAESYEDRSYVCTCYGSTRIASAAQPDSFEDVTTTHHDAPRFILANPEGGKLILPAPVFNHTDEELMIAEAIVGRKPPFSNLNDYNQSITDY